MDMTKTGEFMRALRKAKGLTQEDVAEKLFVSPKTVSRWESGGGIPDINIIQSVAEFYGVTVDELLSGERKTYDEETLSYETQKNKAEGRARLIKESALRQYNLFFIIAASCFAVFWLVAVILKISGNSTLFTVFLIMGAAAAAGLAFYGYYEAKRGLSSVGDVPPDEMAEGIAEAKKEISRKSLLLSDIVAGAVCLAFFAGAFIGWTPYIEGGYFYILDLSIISNAIVPVCLGACYLLIRPHFAKIKYAGNLSDINNRFAKCVFICFLYGTLFTITTLFIYRGYALLTVWLVAAIMEGFTEVGMIGAAFAVMAIALAVVFAFNKKIGFAIAALAAVIASAIFGAIYISKMYYAVDIALTYYAANTSAIILLVVAVAFVVAIELNKRKLSKGKH